MGIEWDLTSKYGIIMVMWKKILAAINNYWG
jgi:hypothetical protein